MDELGGQLRAHGKRLTPQRERVLRAVASLGHATPDEVLEEVKAADTDGAELAPSTVYRCLEALEESGVITHTHLDHRAPSYQLASHDDHVHLVCRGCGQVSQVPVEVAAGFAAMVHQTVGFEADITHMAVHGRCAQCQS